MLPVPDELAGQGRAPQARAAGLPQPPLKRRVGCAGTHFSAHELTKNPQMPVRVWGLIALEGFKCLLERKTSWIDKVAVKISYLSYRYFCRNAAFAVNF